MANLLEKMGTQSAESVARFVVRNHFRLCSYVRIGSLDLNFWDYFTSKIEENIEAATITTYRLNQDVPDGMTVIRELGSSSRIDVALAHIWQLLRKQPAGQMGFLCTDGNANIFCSYGIDGKLWSLAPRWSGNDWLINVYPSDDPDGWPADSWVFTADYKASISPVVLKHVSKVRPQIRKFYI